MSSHSPTTAGTSAPPPLPARPPSGRYRLIRSGSYPLLPSPPPLHRPPLNTPPRGRVENYNPLYPGSPGPRLPTSAALALGSVLQRGDMTAESLTHLDSTEAQEAGQEDEVPQPIDIKARVAAFEKKQADPIKASTPPLLPPRKVASATLAGTRSSASSHAYQTPESPEQSRSRWSRQDVISRVNTTPRNRAASTATTSATSSPSLRSDGIFPGNVSAGSSEAPPQFGALSPQSSRSLGVRSAGLASSPSSSASLPLPSPNGRSLSASPNIALSPFSAAYRGAGCSPHPTTSTSSASSQFDALAESGSMKRIGSGTSLQELTSSSIARARERSATAGVSGKVPLPPPTMSSIRANSSSSSPGFFIASDITGSSSAGGSTGGRRSPALPLRPSHSPDISKRMSAGATHTSNSPASFTAALPLPHNQSMVESPYPSPSVRSTNPLDDDDGTVLNGDGEGGGYSLILHPTLKPTASPASSRPASRASVRSIPSSPRYVHREDPERLSTQQPVRVGVQPPTPSPEKRPLDAPFPSSNVPAVAGYVSKRNSSTDSSTSSSSSSSQRARSPSSRPTSGGYQPKKGPPPSLPPRGGMLPTPVAGLAYAPYKPRAGSGSGLMTSSPSTVASTVASKVPPPPPPLSSSTLTSSTAVPFPQAPAVPPRHATVTAGQSPSTSATSSPTHSPRLSSTSATMGHRNVRSGSGFDHVPRSATGIAIRTSGSSTGLPPLQPPPSRTRLRSSSVGPSSEPKILTRSGESSSSARIGNGYADANANANATSAVAGGSNSAPPPRNTFHGSLAYRASLSSLNGSGGLGTVKRGGLNSSMSRSTPSKPARNLPPKDEAARKRYENLWEREVKRMERKRLKKSGHKGGDEDDPDGTLKDIMIFGGDSGDTITSRTLRPSSAVASLASRFESPSLQPSSSLSNLPSTTTSTTRKPRVTSLSISPPSSATRLSPKRVLKIWARSRLSEKVLGQIWLAALAWDRDCEAVLSPTPPSPFGPPSSLEGDPPRSSSSKRESPSKEAFLRGMAAIDAELEYRSEIRNRMKMNCKSNSKLGYKAAGRGFTTTPSSSAAANAAAGGGGVVSTIAGGGGGGGGSTIPRSHSKSQIHVRNHSLGSGLGSGQGQGGRRRMPPPADEAGGGALNVLSTTSATNASASSGSGL